MEVKINECLCFTVNQYDKLNRVNLATALDFYSLREISDAKEILIIEFEKVGDSTFIKNFKTKRRENATGAKTKIIQDIIDIWEVADRTLGGKLNVLFVASDPNRLPSVNAEKFNVQFLIGSITKLQDDIRGQQELLAAVAQSLSNVHHRLDTTPAPQFADQRETALLSLIHDSIDLQLGGKFSSGVGGAADSSVVASHVSEVDLIPSNLGKRRLSSEEEEEEENPSGAKRIATEVALESSTPIPELPPSDKRLFFPAKSSDSAPSSSSSLPPAPLVATASSVFSALSAPVSSSFAVASEPLIPTAPPAPLSPSAPTSSVETVSAVNPSASNSTASISSAPISTASISSAPISTASISSASNSSASNSSAPTSSAPNSSAPSSSAPSSSVPNPSAPSSSASNSSASNTTLKGPKTPSTKKPSFAEKVKNLNTPSKWNLVQARKNKKIVPIVGSGDSNILKGVPPTPRDFWELSVSRLAEATTDDQVKRQLHKHGIEVKEIFLFPSKIKGTKSARIRVAREHRERAKEAQVWPHGCRVADWVQKSRKGPPSKPASSENELSSS